MSYQDKSDLISFLCFRSHLLTALPSAALSQQLSLLNFWNKTKCFSNPTIHQINIQKQLLVLEWSAWLLVNPPFAEGSWRCSGAEAGLPGWHTCGTSRCAPQGVKAQNTWRNSPRNTLFPCRAVNVRHSPSSKAPCPSLPNEHLHTLHHKCLHSQLITSGIWCAFSQLTEWLFSWAPWELTHWHEPLAHCYPT